MSEQVYSINNQEKFNVGMIVGHIIGTHSKNDYGRKTKEWTYDVEFSNLAYAIYNIVKGKGCSNEEIIRVVENYMHDMEYDYKLPNAEEEDEDYQDFWYGAECGDFFGLPNEKALKKADQAMKLFMDQMKYAYVHEVILENDLI